MTSPPHVEAGETAPAHGGVRPPRPARLYLAEFLRALDFPQVVFFAYLALALVLFTFLPPPFQKPDEVAHYQRSVALTNLEFVCHHGGDGTYYFDMKRKYADFADLIHTWDVAFQPGHLFNRDWLKVDFNDPALQQNTRVQSLCNLPVPGYLPNAIGILVAKPFAGPMTGFYLGRIFGALFFVAAFLVSLRLTPARYRLPLYFFAALPTVLHQVSAISYDAVQLSLYPLLYAFITRFAVSEDRVRWRYLAAFLGTLIWMINIRPLSYVPLTLLYFAVPPGRIATTARRYALTTAAFFAIAGVITLLGAVITIPRVDQAATGDGAVNMREQLRFVAGQPLDFLRASYSTMVHQGFWITLQGIAVFGWIDTPVAFLGYFSAFFVLGIALYHFVTGDQRTLGPLQLAAIFLAISGTVAALFLSLYAAWTPVRGPAVNGLQGRYFIGLLPFAMLGISQTLVNVGRRTFINAGFVILALFWLYYIYHAVQHRFYG